MPPSSKSSPGPKAPRPCRCPRRAAFPARSRLRGAGLRPRLCHPDDVWDDVPADVLGRSVPYPGEVPPILHLGGGLDYGHVAVLVVRDLDQLGVYATQAPAVGLVEQPRKQDVLLSLTGDKEL